MLRTSTDSRTRAQKYADRRWWGNGVKVVGYATHHPVWDIARVKVYSVELLHLDGHKTTRWISVTADTSDAFESTAICGGAEKTCQQRLVERSA